MILVKGKLNIMDLVELQFIENAVSARHIEMESLKNSPEISEAKKKLEEAKQKHEKSLV